MMLVSGLGVTLAIAGLVVTLVVGPGSGEAESDSALPATTTESSSTAPPPAPVPPATTAGATQQFLAELPPVGTTAYTGSLTVDGVPYSHAIYQQFSGCSTEVSHTYDLNREWSRFSSVIGVADGGDTDSTLQFSVVADGKTVFTSGNIGVGTPPKVEVPVSGVENLTIGFTLLDGDSSSCAQLGNGVWGDPTLTK
ncbi:NPCBM/NEW2 domain-containing protein [Nocardia flavorosea]|nr:NPCBM/NEW2 domain-containing protein [Nocardia flavorosea]